MSGPLSGLKVVEVGVAMAGPFCGMMLGDYGAEVIKIERVGAGDDSRHWPPYFHGQLGHYYASANRNKESLAVDLKTKAGVEAARRLMLQADIVVDNYRIGALARAGLDYESLAAENPRLIYCAISGFGATGPRSGDAANDLFMQAYAGGMSITGEVGRGPVKMGLSVADIGAGMLATIGILMAVEARHRTGRGQRVDTSLLEGQMAMLSYHLTSHFATGKVPGPSGSGNTVSVPYQAFHAADAWMVVAVFNDRMFRNFCEAVGQPDWASDPRFLNGDGRSQHHVVLIDLIGRVLSQHPVAYWVERLAAAAVPCSPVNTLDKIVAEEQVVARDMVVEIDVPDLGPIKMAGLPVKFTETPGQIRTPPPRLGQHSADVLRRAGYSDADISAMGESGAIGLDRSHQPT